MAFKCQLSSNNSFYFAKFLFTTCFLHLRVTICAGFSTFVIGSGTISKVDLNEKQRIFLHIQMVSIFDFSCWEMFSSLQAYCTGPVQAATGHSCFTRLRQPRSWEYCPGQVTSAFTLTLGARFLYRKYLYNISLILHVETV